MSIPSLAEFLARPKDAIREHMPATIIYTPGGTRRDAALHGIDPYSQEYVHWSRQRMMACVELLFSYGARHVMMVALWPRQMAETGIYRERLLQAYVEGLGGEVAVADYQQRGWRVRLSGVEELPALAAVDTRLHNLLYTDSKQPAIWWSFHTHFGASWSSILAVATRSGAHTRDELVRALYGEDIPPAGIWLGFGKPMASADILPMLMLEETQCYWTQRPGYNLNDEALRHILYDYAYLRHTWRSDKTDRYAEVLAQRLAWEQAPTLGIGQQLGSYWYPQLIPEGLL